MKAIVLVGEVKGVDGEGCHVYYFPEEIGSEELDFEISQLCEFYEQVVVFWGERWQRRKEENILVEIEVE